MKKIILILAAVLIGNHSAKSQAPWLSGYGGEGFTNYILFYGDFSNTTAYPDTVTYTINTEAYGTLNYLGTQAFIVDSFFFEDSLPVPSGDTFEVFVKITNGYGSYYDTFSTVTRHPTAVSEVASNNGRVWLSSGSHSIHYEGFPESVDMTITNLLGQSSKTIYLTDASGQVDASELSSGVYIVKCVSNEGKALAVKKIMIE